MAAPSEPIASKNKRKYNKAFEETSGANKNICKKNIKVVHCKKQHDQRLVLSTIYDAKIIPYNDINRLLSNEQINQINDRRIELDDEEDDDANGDIENIQNGITNKRNNIKLPTTRTNSCQSKTIQTRENDVICIPSSSESELSDTELQLVRTCVFPDTIKKESDANIIESKQDLLFWKDVQEALKNQEQIYQLDNKPLSIFTKNVRRSTRKRNLSKLISIDSDESNETDESENSSSARIIKSPQTEILPNNVNNVNINSNDDERIEENLFWKHIEDAFDNQDNIFWKEGRSAFQNRILTGFVVNKTHADPDTFFADCKKMITVKINTNFKKTTALKINAIFCCEFKLIKNQNEIFQVFYIDSEVSKVYKNDDFDRWYYEEFRDPIITKFLEHQERDSGWTLSAIIHLKINMSPINVLQGNSYIKTPKEIRLRKACLNVQNTDNKCFLWAVLAALYQPKRAWRPQNILPYKDKLNLNGIKFPMKIHQIPCFEKQNNISINVFIMKLNTDKERSNKYLILPEYVSRKQQKSHVNLLLIKDKYSEESDSEAEDSSKRNYHYICIKRMSALFNTQLGANKNAVYICNFCLYHTRAKKKFEEHVLVCQIKYASEIRLAPTESSLINHFSSIKKIMKKKKAPFVIYMDYKCNFKEEKRFIYSIGMYIMCTYDSSLSSYQCHRGDDCMPWFANALQRFIENVETVFVCDLPKAELSKKDRKLYEENNTCFICEKPITQESKKVRNNCHFTGKFRGPAHEICNMNFRDHRTISVFVHNRKENDSLLIMEYLETKYFNRTEINTQPRTKKKFIPFIKYSDCVIKFKFMNSFELLNGDLDGLAGNLSKLPVLQSEISEGQPKLLIAKLIYPDDLHFDPERLLENTLLPISDFENASAQDYEHANRVWNAFKLKNFGEYSDLHLKRSILLLVDVFEDFRKKCIGEFELDPSYYHNLPDYSWDVMLRKTNVTFELITDMDMVLFFESGTREGLSQCLMKYSKANNANLKDYNSQEEVKYLINFNTNDLYEWAMCQYLPYGEFKWVEDFDGFDVEIVSDEASTGYILEVDLDYTDDVHYEHKDLPFCPEYENGRLKATLNHKTNYIIHYRYLKQALKNGLHLMKIHRILEFKQSAWLKPYFERNMKLHAKSTNAFEKDLFERMNYGIFEYFSKNFRDENRGKILTKYDKRFGVHDMVSKREFRSIDVLNDEFVYIESKPAEVKIDSPIYLHMCVQDLAKTKIYDFHYEYMKKKFSEKCNLCYMDNDSLLYEIREENMYNAIKEDCEDRFNTSNYPSNNVWKIPQVNGKTMGLFKDKHSGRVLSEFVALGPKLYECRFEGANNLSNTKKIGKQIDAKRIIFEDFFHLYDSKNNLSRDN